MFLGVGRRVIPPPLLTLLYSRESGAAVHEEFLGFSCVLHTAWSGVGVKVVTLNVFEGFSRLEESKHGLSWDKLGMA